MFSANPFVLPSIFMALCICLGAPGGFTSETPRVLLWATLISLGLPPWTVPGPTLVLPSEPHLDSSRLPL